MINKFSWNSSYGIGVDIGGTKVLIIIADDRGNVILKEKIKTPSNINEIVETIKCCISRMGVPPKKIFGMGVGVPGRVNSEEGIVLDSPSLKWENLKLRNYLSKHFDFPIFIANDVNLGVIGERWLGKARNFNDIYYIAFGTGVGSAIVANGEIIEGSNFAAGEIGYFIDIEDILLGKKNSFLNFGTFEQKTSGTALTEMGMVWGCSPPKLFEQYKTKNVVITPIIKGFIINVSIAIANVVSLLNPEIVIISGGVAESIASVIGEIKDKVALYTPISTRIEISELGGDAGALGGIASLINNKKIMKLGG